MPPTAIVSAIQSLFSNFISNIFESNTTENFDSIFDKIFDVKSIYDRTKANISNNTCTAKIRQNNINIL